MKQIDVAAAVIHRDGKVLAAQRGYGGLAGGWEFPGGKVEPGESPEEALVREVAEELAVTVAVERPVAVVDYEYETFRLHMHCFLAHVERGRIRLLEHSDARWLGADDIDSVAWLPADIQVIEAIRQSGVLKPTSPHQPA